MFYSCNCYYYYLKIQAATMTYVFYLAILFELCSLGIYVKNK